MTGPAVARLTSLAVVAGGGMALGHLLNPLAAGGVRAGPAAAFALATGLLGAWRGWREAAVRAAWHDEAVTTGARARGAAAGAGAALATAALAYAAVHGA